MIAGRAEGKREEVKREVTRLRLAVQKVDIDNVRPAKHS